MKKITLLVFAITGLSLASCKKDRTCTCTSTSTVTTVNSGSNTTSYSDTETSSDTDVTIIKKSSKSVARPNCLSVKGTDVDVLAEGTIYETTQTNNWETKCDLK